MEGRPVRRWLYKFSLRWSTGYLLMCNKLLHNIVAWHVKKISHKFLWVRKSGAALAGCFEPGCSHEVAVRVSSGAGVSWRLHFTEWRLEDLLPNGLLTQLLATWTSLPGFSTVLTTWQLAGPRAVMQKKARGKAQDLLWPVLGSCTAWWDILQ